MRKNCYGLLTPSSEASNMIQSMASLRKDEWNTTAYIFKCQRGVLKMISQVEKILGAEAWIKVKILSRIYVINGIFKSNRICPNGGERLLFRNSPNLILVWKRSLPQQPHKYMRFWKVAFCTSAEKSLRIKKNWHNPLLELVFFFQPWSEVNDPMWEDMWYLNRSKIKIVFCFITISIAIIIFITIILTSSDVTTWTWWWKVLGTWESLVSTLVLAVLLLM